MSGWEFIVEESFTITGRGTGVFGTFRGDFTENGKPAELHVGGDVRRIENVWLEFARYEGTEGRALMLYGVGKENVPPGARLTGPVA